MRKEELRGSCASLGIDLARCVALDHAELQDNPKVWWNTDLIQSIVAEYVQKWDIDAVSLSFLFPSFLFPSFLFPSFLFPSFLFPSSYLPSSHLHQSSTVLYSTVHYPLGMLLTSFLPLALRSSPLTQEASPDTSTTGLSAPL